MSEIWFLKSFFLFLGICLDDTECNAAIFYLVWAAHFQYMIFPLFLLFLLSSKPLLSYCLFSLAWWDTLWPWRWLTCTDTSCPIDTMFLDKLRSHLLMVTIYCVSHFFLIATWQLHKISLNLLRWNAKQPMSKVIQIVTSRNQMKIWNVLPLSNDTTYINVPFSTTCPLLL